MRAALSILVAAILLIAAAVPATAHPPYGIAVDERGDVYFLDWPTRRVLRMDAEGNARVVVDFTKRGIKAHPHALALDRAGRLLVAETYGRRIWIVERDGTVRLHPWVEQPDDGLGDVQDIEVGPRGRLHLMRRQERPGKGSRFVLQRLDSGGEATVLFDVPNKTYPLYGSCFAIGPKGAVWVSRGNRVLRLRDGKLEVIAGSKEAGHRDGSETHARFDGCYGIAAEASGSVVVVEERGGRVRRIAGNGTVTTVAADTKFDGPYQVEVDVRGRIYVAEALREKHRIRVIEGGRVRTLGTVRVGTPREQAPPRTLAAFQRLSDANAARASVAELTGLHPTRDWPLSLWVQRAHDERMSKPWDAPLFLNGVTALSVEQARALVTFKGNKLFLPDLETLSPAVAEVLAASGKSLYLDGLQTMDVPRGRPLSRSTGQRLSLRGLRELTPRAAKRLSDFDGSLLLDGVSKLSENALLLIARWDGWGEHVLLSLGLTSLDAEQARTLGDCRGWGVALDQVKTLTPAAAKELGKLDTPYLSLNGLTSISLETAKVIATWKRKFLTLNGVKAVSAEVRALVEQGCEAVSWRGLAKPK